MSADGRSFTGEWANDGGGCGSACGWNGTCSAGPFTKNSPAGNAQAKPAAKCRRPSGVTRTITRPPAKKPKCVYNVSYSLTIKDSSDRYASGDGKLSGTSLNRLSPVDTSELANHIRWRDLRLNQLIVLDVVGGTYRDPEGGVGKISLDVVISSSNDPGCKQGKEFLLILRQGVKASNNLMKATYAGRPSADLCLVSSTRASSKRLAREATGLLLARGYGPSKAGVTRS